MFATKTGKNIFLGHEIDIMARLAITVLYKNFLEVFKNIKFHIKT
jgi:hypothetical protein